MATLTQKEKAWIARLEKTLAAAPKSLGGKVSSYTIGDNDITVYDKDVLERYTQDNGDAQDVCTLVDRSDAEIVSLRFPFDVESTAG